MQKKEIARITSVVAKNFRSFGGGKVDSSNPISVAFKNRPPAFASGVNIEEVVRFVVSEIEKSKKKLTKKRVLVIDDDTNFSGAIADLIESVDAGKVISAVTLAQSKKKLAYGRYDVILWDYELPDGNTLDLLKSVCKKHKKTLMIASGANDEDRKLQMASGCTKELPSEKGFEKKLLKLLGK